MSRTVVLDEYGHHINQLTQWDLNRTIVIDDYEYDAAPVIHFCNRSSDEALPIEGELSNKKVTAKIPNNLLERTDTILVYICLCDSEKNILETINYFELPIKRRPKPKDYIYVQNTDYIRISDLKKELEEFKNDSEESFSGIETEFNNIKSDVDKVINTVNTAINNTNAAANSAKEIKTIVEEALNNGSLNGTDGISIVDVEIINNDLIITLSNDEKINAGKIKDDAKKYGVCYDMNSKNPKLTRIGDAKYLKAGIANGADDTDVVNDFDKIYPWSDIKRCTRTNDGTITSYEGDPNYTENGSIGEVLSEIPEHYRMTYISEATGKMYHYVSREKLNEYYKFVPKTYVGSFLMTDDSTKSVGESRSGGYYPGKYSYTNARNVAMARGTNWHSMDIWDYETIKTLFIIEFATLDSQSVFKGNELGNPYDVDIFPDEFTMKDILDPEGEVQFDDEYETDWIVCAEPNFLLGDEIRIETSSKINSDWTEYEQNNMLYAIRKIIEVTPIDETLATDYYPDAQSYHLDAPVRIYQSSFCQRNTARNGMTNDIKASSGKLLSYENGENSPPLEGSSVWRGIENLVGINYTWLDGILLCDGKYWVCDDPSKYANNIHIYDADGNVTEEYQYTPISFELPTATGYITKMGYDEETGLTLPIETGGSSDIGYCDNFYKPRSITSMSTVRFGGIDNLSSGLFNMYCMLNASNATAYSARLSYRHY